MKIASLLRFLLTAAVVALALLLGRALWQHYLYSPWTRDGRVRADVVQVAPDVSGLVSRVAVRDNQFVRKGELLFVIDQARFRNAVAQAEANLAAAVAGARAAGASISAAAAGAAARRAEYEMYAAQAERRQRIGDVISKEARNDAVAAANSARATWQQAQAGGSQAAAAREQAAAAVEQAQAALDRARLDLARTEVRAPVDGYVTNLDLRVGDYAAAGAARLALIDSHSYYIYGYFEETKLPQLRVGDGVDIRLMAGGARLKGTITGIARGITDRDNPAGSDLLADVNPTFNWVRLAQRVPVRIAIDTEHLPRDVLLAAGMTATIEVHPHRAGGG
ncbi:biotin/lipoyl-binding protein [Fulvimonas soli]|uniref:Multidrug resistance efflux pump n=1 Tax=Fulvimonas soli TaxID=155197 RepID=A0A316IYK6_9GAMM|nr:HlyD family secretion protein [Fulvimonas soli]PWK92325.1 multidrug resistance efflux pump [Fulvimonas soli]TNY28011.1 efflux transporter periplasmic adaptor subunit [Fulvimonas soli]